VRPAQNSAVPTSDHEPSRFQQARKSQRKAFLAEGSEAIYWKQQRFLRRDVLTINQVDRSCYWQCKCLA